MFLEEALINQFAKKQAKEIDKCLYEFLESNGYRDVKNMNIIQLEKLFEKLKGEDKQLRYEIYNKPLSENNSIGYNSIIIPFFDSYSNPLISRVGIYKSLKLEERGYIL